MTISFYDKAIEAMREATQEDWDLRQQRLAEQFHEIERLRGDAEVLHEFIEQLRARIIELEAQLAALGGTLATTRDGGMPFEVVETPPTTPR